MTPLPIILPISSPRRAIASLMEMGGKTASQPLDVHRAPLEASCFLLFGGSIIIAQYGVPVSSLLKKF